MKYFLFLLIPLKRVLYFVQNIIVNTRNGIKWLFNSKEHTNFSYLLNNQQIKHISYITSSFFNMNQDHIEKEIQLLQSVEIQLNKNSEKSKLIDLDKLPKWDYRLIIYSLMSQKSIPNIFEFGIDQGRTGYLVYKLATINNTKKINYVGIEYNHRKGVLLEHITDNRFSVIYSKLENVIKDLNREDLEESILLSSTHEEKSEHFLFDYLEKNKIFPKVIISDETSIDSPYIKFVNNNRYENVIFPIEDPSNFLDTMYIGLAKRDLD